ncbi:MAG: hypothetical protein ABUT20_32895 [Bacteroidota bacterium]
MATKHILLSITSLASLLFANAQQSKADSSETAKTFKTLLSICRNIDFADPKTSELGLFYKAAPYIIYRGEDKARAWKDFANYSKAEDKKGVDEVCTRINETVNRDSSYTIVKYFTEKESEGTWHVLMITYKKKGAEKRTAFAFLKIGKKFGLGNID